MILNFLKKDKKNDFNDQNKELTKMIALLIHAARIDENYTEKEKKLIINFAEMSSKKNLSKNRLTA